MPTTERDGPKAGVQKIPLLETLEGFHRGRGRAGDAASLRGYTWDHHRKFALVATLCRRKGFMMDLGMLHLTPT